jgi:decaprenyl-phosphate phosphoribosyltransferase
VIRLISGSVQTDIAISNWFILCIFLASLIMIFSKRYCDSFLTKENKKLTKSNEMKLNIKITSLAMILVYIFFTFSSYANNNFSSFLHLGTIFLILAIVRFVKETLTNKITSEPSSFLIKDFYFLLFTFGWFISFIISKLLNHV